MSHIEEKSIENVWDITLHSNLSNFHSMLVHSLANFTWSFSIWLAATLYSLIKLIKRICKVLYIRIIEYFSDHYHIWISFVFIGASTWRWWRKRWTSRSTWFRRGVSTWGKSTARNSACCIGQVNSMTQNTYIVKSNMIWALLTSSEATTASK